MSTLIKIKNGSGEPGQTNANELGEPLWRTDTNTLYVRNAAGLPVSVVRAFDGCEISPAPEEVIAGYTGSVRSSLVDYSPIGINGINSVQINSTNTPVSLNSAKKLALRERSPYSENAWSEIVKAMSTENENQFLLSLSNQETIIIDLSLGNARIKLSAGKDVLFWRPSAEGRSFTVNDLSNFSGKIADFSTVYAVIIDVTDVCQSDHTLLIDNKGYIKIGPVAFVKKDKLVGGNNIYSYSESAAVKSYSNIHGDSASVRAGSSITKSWSSDSSGSDDKIDQCGSIAYNLKVRTGNTKKNLVFGDPYTNCPYPGTLMITVTEDLGRMYSLTSTTDEGTE